MTLWIWQITSSSVLFPMRTTMKVKVVCAPMHTRDPGMRDALESILVLNPFIAGLTEMHNAHDRIIMHRVFNEKYHICNGGRSGLDYHSSEVPILIRKRRGL